MRSYRPSGVITGGGFLSLLIVAVLSGLIIGGILWAVDNYIHFYLVGLFPLVGGGIAGAALAAVVRGNKVRSPLAAGLMGLLAGFIMFGVYHFASYYVTFRGEIRANYVERYPDDTFTDAEFEDYINEGLEEEVGDSGFVGYLKYAADAGITITSTRYGSSSSPLELQGNAAFIYWIVEILGAALVAAGVAWAAAREPFDENTNQWYGSPMVLAQGTTKSRKALLRALKEGSFEDAGGLLTQQQIKYPRVEIWARRSPDAAAEDVLLMVKHVQRKGRPSNIKTGMVSTSELNRMMKAVDVAVAANPVVSKG